jgi:hypothetical protein
MWQRMKVASKGLTCAEHDRNVAESEDGQFATHARNVAQSEGGQQLFLLCKA